MKEIRVDLAERSYNIYIGSGSIKLLNRIILSSGFKGPVVVITDRNVHAKTRKITAHFFSRLRNRAYVITVPASERSKSIKVYHDVVRQIIKKTSMYRPLIVALGGGVVGDLAGFIAATYRRGVPLIQVPTTLLAQVDSSIGGKTGIDLAEAKNIIGSFKQPAAVIIDTDFLYTLPKIQLENGLAEVIKYGVIADRNFFGYLENNMDRILRLDRSAMEKIVAVSAAIKAAVVEKDEFDVKDVRIALNFGHTLAHGIESASRYSGITHGQAVAIGMVAASDMAVELGMLSRKEFDRIRRLIKRAGLPVLVPRVGVDKIMAACRHDKKFVSGSSRFVLPRAIGSVVVVNDIPEILVNSIVKKNVR